MEHPDPADLPVSRETSRLHLRLYGGVQGVGFRYFAAQAAHRLGVHGWVRNNPDGSVEIEAEGAPQTLAEFRKLVSAGPPHATVGKVEDLPPGTAELPRPFAIVRPGR